MARDLIHEACSQLMEAKACAVPCDIIERVNAEFVAQDQLERAKNGGPTDWELQQAETWAELWHQPVGV